MRSKNTDLFSSQVSTETWQRRLKSLPVLFLLFIVMTAVFPLVISCALLYDVITWRRWATLRAILFFEVLLLMEVMGVLVSLFIFLADLSRSDTELFMRRNYALQNWWGRTLANAGIMIYGLKIEVEPVFELKNKPFILFIQHTSFVDTILPLLLISSEHGVRLRYVLKSQLLWDPCLDIVGNRIPNVFVHPRARDAKSQMARIKDLAKDLSNKEGIVIYPEGTRYSREKKERVLERAQRRGEEAYRTASRFRSVMPPIMGGAMALLEAAADADAVFCAHSGLESTVTLNQLVGGDLIDQTIRVSFRRVARHAIPEGDLEREEWLLNQWELVDETVTAWRRLEDKNA